MNEGCRHDIAPDADTTRAAWLRRLVHQAPTTVLKKLTAGDPLQLSELGSRRLRERALFVDTDRLFTRAAIEIAHRAAAYAEEIEPLEWLTERVDAAIDGVLSADREEERLGVEPDAHANHPIPFLATVEPARGRRAAVEFNALPDATRVAFFALLIEGQSIEACLARGLGPSEVLRERVRRGLEVLQSPVAREDECAA